MMQRAAANSGDAVMSEQAASDLRCRSASLMASSSSRRRRRTADLEDAFSSSVIEKRPLSVVRCQLFVAKSRLDNGRRTPDNGPRTPESYVAVQAKDYSRR